MRAPRPHVIQAARQRWHQLPDAYWTFLAAGFGERLGLLFYEGPTAMASFVARAPTRRLRRRLRGHGRAPLCHGPSRHSALRRAPDPAAETLLLDSPFRRPEHQFPARSHPTKNQCRIGRRARHRRRKGVLPRRALLRDRPPTRQRPRGGGDESARLGRAPSRRPAPRNSDTARRARSDRIVVGPVLVLTDEGPNIGLLGALVFPVGAALLTTGALWLRSLRPTWHMVLATSAGHVSFVSVHDRAWVEGFQQAVQLAMVARG